MNYFSTLHKVKYLETSKWDILLRIDISVANVLTKILAHIINGMENKKILKETHIHFFCINDSSLETIIILKL